MILGVHKNPTPILNIKVHYMISKCVHTKKEEFGPRILECEFSSSLTPLIYSSPCEIWVFPNKEQMVVKSITVPI